RSILADSVSGSPSPSVRVTSYCNCTRPCVTRSWAVSSNFALSPWTRASNSVVCSWRTPPPTSTISIVNTTLLSPSLPSISVSLAANSVIAPPIVASRLVGKPPPGIPTKLSELLSVPAPSEPKSPPTVNSAASPPVMLVVFWPRPGPASSVLPSATSPGAARSVPTVSSSSVARPAAASPSTPTVKVGPSSSKVKYELSSETRSILADSVSGSPSPSVRVTSYCNCTRPCVTRSWAVSSNFALSPWTRASNSVVCSWRTPPPTSTISIVNTTSPSPSLPSISVSLAANSVIAPPSVASRLVGRPPPGIPTKLRAPLSVPGPSEPKSPPTVNNAARPPVMLVVFWPRAPGTSSVLPPSAA